MAKVKMQKMTLAAPQGNKNEILSLLQSKACVQIIDLKDAVEELEGTEYFKDSKAVTQTEINYNHIKFSYEFLKTYNTDKSGLMSKRDILSKKEFDEIDNKPKWERIYEETKLIEELLNANKNKKSKILSLIEQYENWKGLDVNTEELSKLRNTAYYIGTISQKFEAPIYSELNSLSDEIYIEKLYHKQDVNVFILCHKDMSNEIYEVLKKYGFSKLNLDLSQKPSEQIESMNKELIELAAEYENLTGRAQKLAEHLRDIEKSYDYASSILEKTKAGQGLIKTQKALILNGWVPIDQVLSLKKALEGNFEDIYVNFEDAAEDDNPPIVLKNNFLSEPFEVITSMYALPTNAEIDPTPVLAPFYLLFFGMMAGDIGYGFVLLFVTSFALKFMDIDGEAKKIVKMLLYCSIPTIIFGWVFGGFFGDAIKIKPLWMNPLDDPMKVLYLSLALGVVHLFTGLGVKAYMLIKSGKVLDAIFDVFFWYLLLIGLMWLLLGGSSIAKYMAIAGAVGLFATQGRANTSIAGKIFGGIYGLYGVTSYIGDVLSYSRLLALGLATSLIGSSFNMLIKLLGNGAIAFAFGTIIFLGGHTFNFLIGMLGTFVHTCRLEYLEFFGKFYEGGGKAFQPLKISSKFIKVITE